MQLWNIHYFQNHFRGIPCKIELHFNILKPNEKDFLWFLKKKLVSVILNEGEKSFPFRKTKETYQFQKNTLYVYFTSKDVISGLLTSKEVFQLKLGQYLCNIDQIKKEAKHKRFLLCQTPPPKMKDAEWRMEGEGFWVNDE